MIDLMTLRDILDFSAFSSKDASVKNGTFFSGFEVFRILINQFVINGTG